MRETLALLERLIAFETVSTQSNLPLIDFVETYLVDLGFRVTRLPSPDGKKAGLYAELGPQVEGGVLLSAHTDVVPVTGQNWTRAPFRLTTEGERLYGRGTTDMKGFLASMLSLGRSAAQVELNAPLQLVMSYDEEIGCVGIAEMRDRLPTLIGKPRVCIVGEPTEMKVATGHKGKMSLTARFKGEAGHSALAPRYLNALHLAGDFMTGLRALQAEFETKGNRDTAYDVPYSTVHIGRLSGGTAVNIVPDHAEMAFEFRHLAADDPQVFLDRVTCLAQSLQAALPAGSITLTTNSVYPGLDTETKCAAARYVEKIAQTHTTKVAFGTEAGTFKSLGIPTVVCGPGSMEGQGHKCDEYIELQQLVLCDQLLKKLLHDLI